MRVYKIEDKTTKELIFEGIKEDCIIVEQVLSEYHKYDSCIEIILEAEVPEFNSLDDFFKVYEYKYTYNQLKK